MLGLLQMAKLVVSGFDTVIRLKLVPEGKMADYQERKGAWTYAVQRLSNGGKREMPVRSEEEVLLENRMKTLKRFERKRDRDGLKARRGRSRPLADRKAEALPELESDIV